jgi:hypothetical protein
MKSSNLKGLAQQAVLICALAFAGAAQAADTFGWYISPVGTLIANWWSALMR